ncbi:MAG: GNAT family N-acetyltransferase [Actinomycetota bacterium]|nr:GNAT family N-acetyltransferase [Actinomycetota bacterium]
MRDLLQSQRLLREVFADDRKYRNSAYLQWLYTQSPSGLVIAADHDDDLGRVGHYAVIPQRWLRAGEPALYALSLNTAVAERARGQGLFTRLARAAYKTSVERGVDAIVGVANENSTPGFIGKLGFRNLGPLPVIATSARPTRSVPRIIAADQLPGDDVLNAQASLGDTRRTWDAQELAWRLQAPNETYLAVRLPDALVIACTTKVAGLKFAVILKVFTLPSRDPVDTSAIVAHVCRATRSPFVVYAGFNPQFRLSGLVVPMRLRPSPLNLIIRSADESQNTDQFIPDCFEFLDFDAY